MSRHHNPGEAFGDSRPESQPSIPKACRKHGEKHLGKSVATARGQAGRDIKDGSKTEHTHTHTTAQNAGRGESLNKEHHSGWRWVAVGGGGWRNLQLAVATQMNKNKSRARQSIDERDKRG